MQAKPEKAQLARNGLNLINGAIRNNVEAGVLAMALSKVKIIQVGLRGEELAARLQQPCGVAPPSLRSRPGAKGARVVLREQAAPLQAQRISAALKDQGCQRG